MDKEGSCGYEASCDQLYNDGGKDFEKVKNKLLGCLKALPVDERRTFAVAMLGTSVASVNIRNDRQVFACCSCW